MPSGPAALHGFKSFSNFLTPFGFTVMSCIDGCGLGPLSGMVPVSS